MTSPHPKVRVRFAPAPSGSLHVGNARTALFNWLFARHHAGVFVLRVEDTDPSRVSEEAIAALEDVLRWLGLDWDEGPDVGGLYAPYRQSERAERYHDAVETLVRGGRAYRCYCTPEELERRRKAAMAEGKTPGYDGRCRTLSDLDRAAYAAEGRPSAMRFWVPEGETAVEDIVRGEVRFSHDQIADFVIMRSGGTPTYLLAAAVDDLAMDITHVIRGEDLLSAAPRQILVYQALGRRSWPAFAHLPLIVGADRQPLSKRHGVTAVEWYRESGFLPEAMVNYLALLGWSAGDGIRERFTREELIELFSLDGVSKNPAAFDVAKLTALNGERIRGLDPGELARRIEPFLVREGVLPEEPPEADRVLARRAVPLIQERMARLDEAPSQLRFLFAEVEPDERARGMLTAERIPTLERSLAALEALSSWDHASIREALEAVGDELGLKKKEAFQPMRAAVTGSLVSPPLFESLEILGRQRSLARIRAGLERAKGVA